MKKGDRNQTLKKSKSMWDISTDIPDAVPSDVAFYADRKNLRSYRKLSRTYSESSVEVATVDYGSEEGAQAQLADSGVADQSSFDGHALIVLEHKIDRLSDMFQEQCRLLTTLKEDIRNSKAAMEKVEQYQTDILADFVKKTVYQSSSPSSNEKDGATDAGCETNSRARSLLDAIEVRQGSAVDLEVRDALASFLQSDELKEHMVAATAESVRSVIGDCISRDLSALYLPMLEHSHRRLVRTVGKIIEDAFTELEENSACLSRSVYKISRSLRRSMDRHQQLLQAAADPPTNLVATFKCTVEELLHKELKQWRQKVLDVFTELRREPEEPPQPEPLQSAPAPAPASPLQPPDTDHSIIDQLMMAAEICNQIEAGEVNAAFERALSAADLALVTAACRHGAAVVFAPRCRLRQHVLLALLQQLSTDMLHDTELKCRYLEDCIMSVDCRQAATRAHLPLVVGELRHHLSRFLAAHPAHAASRRIALIIMAADNLLK